MKTEEHNKLINGIKEKLGEEETSKIADDLALLISDNTQVNNELKNKEKRIAFDFRRNGGTEHLQTFPQQAVEPFCFGNQDVPDDRCGR